MIWAEVRGDDEVSVLDRRIEPRVWRQALSVALFSVAAVVISTFVLMEITQISFDAVLYETVSAFATVGLSTGITATLPARWAVGAGGFDVHRPARAHQPSVGAGAARAAPALPRARGQTPD